MKITKSTSLVFSTLLALSMYVSCSSQTDSLVSVANESGSTSPQKVTGVTVPVRGLYVNKFKAIVGDTAKENKLLRFIKAKSINYVSLYDMGWLLDQASKYGYKDKIANFIQKARLNGVTEVSASGGWTGHFDLFASYNTKYAATPTKQIDIFNLESEFWNGASTFDEWITLLQYMKTKAGTKKCEAYLSANWSVAITHDMLETVRAQNLYRLLLTCYTKASTSFDCNVAFYNNLKSPTAAVAQNVMPLFSSETSFMGPNLDMNAIESNWLTKYNAAVDSTQQINVVGNMYFAYTYFTPVP